MLLQFTKWRNTKVDFGFLKGTFHIPSVASFEYLLKNAILLPR